MKITDLHLLAFGPFEGVRLDMRQGSEGLHIVYGPNEAGKSSALRALRAAFYGIPLRSPDNFRHPYNKLRIGATVRHSDGSKLTFIRRKGSKNTLRSDNDEKILDDAMLDHFLNGIDEALFSTMFGIDHGDLVQGGKEILTGGGNLGELIFAAGSGISGLRNIQAQLQDHAEALFKPSGKLPKINQSILQIKENRKILRDLQLSSSVWEQHEKALSGALEQKQSTDRQLTEAQAEKNRLERIRKSFPLIARRKKLSEDLTDYASVVLLPQDFSTQRRDLMSKRKIAANDRQQAADHIRQIREEINRIDFSDKVLNSENEIETIYQQLGGYKKAARDRIPLETRMDILRSEAKQILHDLRNDLTIDQADQLRLTKKDTLHIQELGSRYERIVTLAQSIRDEIPKISHHIEKIDGQLADLPAPLDIEELILAVEQVSDLAPMEYQCLDDIAEISLGEKSLAVELGRQTFWSGRLEDIERLPLLSLESIDRFETDFENLRRMIQKNDDDIKQFNTRLADVMRQTEELNLKFTVPTESMLISARQKRDAFWQMIAGMMEQPDNAEMHSAEFQKQFPEETNLISAFENSMRSADHLADRLRREADRVATLAKLVSEQSDIETRLKQVEKEKKDNETTLAGIFANWTDQWKDSGISPAAPREMRVWTNRIMDLRSRYSDLKKRLSRARTKLNTIQEARSRLLKVLESVNASSPDSDTTLGALIKRAGKHIEHEKKLNDKREKILAEKAQKQAQLSDLKMRYQATEEEMALWQQQWEKAVTPLGLDAQSMPAHASAFLEDLKHLFDKLKEADILKKRISGIDRDAAAFQSSVHKLAGIAAPRLIEFPPEQTAAEMMRILNETRTAHSKIQTLENQLQREQQRLEQAEKSVINTEAFLKTMCEEARCSGYQELPDAEIRSEKKRELDEALKSVETRLLEMSAGSSIEDFVEECLAEAPDRIESQIHDLSERIDRLSAKKSELDQTIGSERTELSKMDGSARAAEIAEDTQFIIGRLESQVETYARYKIAAAVLSAAVEQFRDRNQSPVLRKAGALFARITGGSFEGIRAEFDDAGNPVIVGVRAKTRETVHVDGMSEGTADQLYLAFRLAGVEEYLEKNEPVPFIIDDILIKFDNSRALAALEVLAGLSARTQIIFFTHHRHLLEMAMQHIDPSVLFCHHLTHR